MAQAQRCLLSSVAMLSLSAQRKCISNIVYLLSTASTQHQTFVNRYRMSLACQMICQAMHPSTDNHTSPPSFCLSLAASAHWSQSGTWLGRVFGPCMFKFVWQRARKKFIKKDERNGFQKCINMHRFGCVCLQVQSCSRYTDTCHSFAVVPPL